MTDSDYAAEALAEVKKAAPATPKCVLNVGSGSRSSQTLRSTFPTESWKEIRLDIDPTTQPDVIGSLTNIGTLFAPQSIDAIWASHVLEHLFRHEVRPALIEIRSVLKRDGFAVITCPDIEVAASLVAQYGMDHVIYHSPAGPITAHDMFYGHTASIANGHTSMAHKTAFTCSSLAQCLLDVGFSTVLAKSERYAIWAVALMDYADRAAIVAQLARGGLDMSTGSAG